MSQSNKQVRFRFGASNAESTANNGDIVFDDVNQCIYVFGKTFYCKDTESVKPVWDVESDMEEVVVPTHDYVDLGYGLKFATCNLGAEKPEDYGMYFQWGGIDGELITGSIPSKVYDFDHCPYIVGDGTKWSIQSINKYNNGDFDGTVDNKLVLDASDDVATQLWGSSWRLPTKDELEMLTDTNKFDNEWTQENGVNGCRFTSKENGNSIFIPVSGICYDSFYYGGIGIGLWSSRLYEDSSDYAWNLTFNSDDMNMNMNGSNRYFGLSVRPVFIG